MKNQLKIVFQFIFFPPVTLLLLNIVFFSCSNNDANYLEFALKMAGDNKEELQKVLDYYHNDSLKLEAAKFLISNMPGHYSFKSNNIEDYYKIGDTILRSLLSPLQQRDTLLRISREQFSYLEYDTIQDLHIISADYLIRNINLAFDLWLTKSWANHLNFEEFCEYLLPYKCSELQSLDDWRDTLTYHFGDILSDMIPNDESYDSPFNAAVTLRREIHSRVKPLGVYAGSGYPFKSAYTMYRITYGQCTDYVRLAICTMRSLGIPVVYESTPQWGRYRAGHDWYTLLNDKGELLPSQWDISTDPGGAFFPYERIPKVYRYTYAINREIEKYLKTAKFKYPFDIFQKDVTDLYFATSDLSIPLTINKKKLVDCYAYLAVFNGHHTDWNILTYGEIIEGCAKFTKIGRNVLYIVLQYDENGWFPLSRPFILYKNGNVDYVEVNNKEFRSVTIRRKYHSNRNVVNMRRRVLYGVIEASNDFSFKNADTIFQITDLDYPDIIPISANVNTEYRFWRYLSPVGSFGSIAELRFFNDSTELNGTIISSVGKDDLDLASLAFDGDWLSNFETDQPDSNWVGMDFNKPVFVNGVRLVPRNDDNGIHPGDEYELLYWNDTCWVSRGKIIASDNNLKYDSIPKGALMWLRNYTRGWDERCFLIDENENVEWW
ncbi:MAG TPA: hypothetical protein VFC94_05985 [Bacteroidaceae bacterium]|nr:hypothetical protein [Bacteroidaceae bacterium]